MNRNTSSRRQWLRCFLGGLIGWKFADKIQAAPRPADSISTIRTMTFYYDADGNRIYATPPTEVTYCNGGTWNFDGGEILPREIR